MRGFVAFALVILPCVPATAQLAQRPSPNKSIETELLEMEQDVDKKVLKKALMLQARQGMRPKRNLSEKEATDLHHFIAKKKEAITARSEALTKSRLGSRRVTPPVSNATPPSESERQAILEKVEKAQIEIQLHQAQLNILQVALSNAVNTLARTELAASDDETQKAKADTARKEFDKIKTKYAELSQQLKKEQWEVQSMHQSIGMGGMGGGFR